MQHELKKQPIHFLDWITIPKIPFVRNLSKIKASLDVLRKIKLINKRNVKEAQNAIEKLKLDNTDIRQGWYKEKAPNISWKELDEAIDTLKAQEIDGLTIKVSLPNEKTTPDSWVGDVTIECSVSTK